MYASKSQKNFWLSSFWCRTTFILSLFIFAVFPFSLSSLDISWLFKWFSFCHLVWSYSSFRWIKLKKNSNRMHQFNLNYLKFFNWMKSSISCCYVCCIIKLSFQTTFWWKKKRTKCSQTRWKPPCMIYKICKIPSKWSDKHSHIIFHSASCVWSIKTTFIIAFLSDYIHNLFHARAIFFIFEMKRASEFVKLSKMYWCIFFLNNVRINLHSKLLLE